MPREMRWPVLVAVGVAIALQVVLPQRVAIGLGPRVLLPALEGLLLVVLLLANPGQVSTEERRLRVIGVALIALVSATNFVSLAELLHALLYGTRAGGRTLVYASVPIWLTNVIAFGLWFWELDRAGRLRGCASSTASPTSCSPRWVPADPTRRGHRVSATTCTRRSRMPPHSVPPTRCR